MTAELRPRSDWEAVDLGLALVRRDFWSLWSIWLLGMSPVLLLAVWLLPDHPFWFCFIFWWWIPVASRLVLFKLSRRLFGDDPSKRDVMREFPKAVSRRFFYRMFWARFSPWRPLTMPVEDLEGLKGKGADEAGGFECDPAGNVAFVSFVLDGGDDSLYGDAFYPGWGGTRVG